MLNLDDFQNSNNKYSPASFLVAKLYGGRNGGSLLKRCVKKGFVIF